MVVLVTGCRSGFGLLTAIEAAKRGHVVYAGVRDLTSAEALRAAAASLPIHPLTLDVVDAEQRQAAVDRVLAEQGRIDALVNNAGVALGGFLETVEEDELRRVLDTNVIAPWALTRAVLPAMRAQRSGTVVMVSSMSGRVGLPGVGVYAASKFALEGMSESWRHELALFGIKLVLVEPAQFKTDIFGRNRTLARGAEDPASPWYPYATHLDTVVKGMVERTAGDPQRVADLVCDLVAAPRATLRHPIGPNAWVRELLGRIVPFWITERVMKRFLRLPGS
jgi:NAD(P)-dependent dehydrogenase (short-subunit alcohol dehydrogenase family)